MSRWSDLPGTGLTLGGRTSAGTDSAVVTETGELSLLPAALLARTRYS